jgi:hypothetical protein
MEGSITMHQRVATLWLSKFWILNSEGKNRCQRLKLSDAEWSCDDKEGYADVFKKNAVIRLATMIILIFYSKCVASSKTGRSKMDLYFPEPKLAPTQPPPSRIVKHSARNDYLVYWHQNNRMAEEEEGVDQHLYRQRCQFVSWTLFNQYFYFTPLACATCVLLRC